MAQRYEQKGYVGQRLIYCTRLYSVERARMHSEVERQSDCTGHASERGHPAVYCSDGFTGANRLIAQHCNTNPVVCHLLEYL